MINHKRPKLVLAKNHEEYLAFLAKYDLTEDEFEEIISPSIGKAYGLILTGSYEENDNWPFISNLIDTQYFRIVGRMPIS